jgi:hypothetical protein
MRSIMGYMMATFVFAGILGVMIGFVGGIIITQKVLEGRTVVAAPSGPAHVTFVLPNDANLEIDGEARPGGPTLELQLEPNQAHEAKVLIDGQQPMTFNLALSPGEHRTVLVPGATTE